MLYRLLSEPEPSSALGVWEKHLGGFREVIGYTALGNFFFRNPETQDYLVLYPLRHGNNSKKYGPFASVLEFEQKILTDSYFVQLCLEPDKVKAIEHRLGALQDDEVYIPVPYPMLGGSGAVETYDKGSVWVFADLVGQTLGL